MTKKIILSVIALLVVISVLGGIKLMQFNRMNAQGTQFSPPPETVSTVVVMEQPWEMVLSSIGSVVAVQGVVVSAEVNGKVSRILFDSGMRVNVDDLLVQQDTSVEEAQLRSAEASVDLAKINVERLRELLADTTIAQSEYDNTHAQYKQAMAQVDNIRALIRKKSIRAPFSGLLGIRQVNLGQILKEGEPIVSLQTLDPIYVNFLLPQQQLSRVRTGLTVRVTTDVLPEQVIDGNITAINSRVDAATRNIEIQSTLSNPGAGLRPGMFVNVTEVFPDREKVLAVPQTSILYAPYENSVFVVEEKKDGGDVLKGLFVRQQFVRLGEKRGDFISVVTGLKQGQTIVSTGVFKLRNGRSVVVDNTLSPEFQLTPVPDNA